MVIKCDHQLSRSNVGGDNVWHAGPVGSSEF